MATGAHKATIRQDAAHVWNQGTIPAVDPYSAPDYQRHDPGIAVAIRGPEGSTHLVPMERSACPAIHLTAADLITEGDKGVAGWTVRGTHRGELLGIPPTDRPVLFTASAIFRRADDGKIAEPWVAVDNLGLLHQRGVLPAPGQATS